MTTLITGGAGFVGTNLAHRLLTEGRSVLLFDNLSRPGVRHNVGWLRRLHADQVRLVEGDVRNRAALWPVLSEVGQVFHLAAQVAVTTSLLDPEQDFEVNARGTFNLLEGLRRLRRPPSLVYTSTNKVYGALPGVPLRMVGQRYEPADSEVAHHGIAEDQELDFRSPYGCSKGTADQYVLDYARSFGLPALVFRMSCIYGPHQFGTEDQGWVAHFLIQALRSGQITLYGDGRQVRDVLFVDDLVEAFLLAQAAMDRLAGEAFNIGGGPSNAVAVLELLDLIRNIDGVAPAVSADQWRSGDQRYYVSDVRKFCRATGWCPRVRVGEGIRALHRWLGEDPDGRRALAVSRATGGAAADRADGASPASRAPRLAATARPSVAGRRA
jgi:CDP-paratose 2-epimerase